MNRYIYGIALISILFFGGCGSEDDTISSLKLNRIANLDLNQIGDDNTEQSAEDMALSADGKTIYLADGSAGLKVIDVTNPNNPKLIAHVDDPTDTGTNRGGFGRRITISPDGDIVYMADGLAGLKVIDVRDPNNPQQIGKLDTDGFSHGITVSKDGKVVIISDNGEDGGKPGVRIIDVSNPSNPIMITQKDEQWATQATLSPDGKKLFVTDKKAGVMIYDLANRIARGFDFFDQINNFANNFKNSKAGTYKVTDGGICADIVLSNDGTKAYIANKKPGIKILDVKDPNHPTLISKFDWDGKDGKSIAKSVALSKDGKRLFVANRSTGVEMIDVSDDKNPKQVARVETGGSAEDVLVSKDGTKLYVANGKAGFAVVDITKE